MCFILQQKDTAYTGHRPINTETIIFPISEEEIMEIHCIMGRKVQKECEQNDKEWCRMHIAGMQPHERALTCHRRIEKIRKEQKDEVTSGQ